MRSIRAATAFAVALTLVAAADADLIVNGSFESPAVPPGGYTNFPAGSTAIPGWTVVGIDSALTSGTFTQSGIVFQAQDGNQWLDTAGITANSNASGVSQDVPTAIGTTYQLRFHVGSCTDNTYFFASTVDLSINGGARTSYTNPTTPTDHFDWREFTVTFTATSTTTNITFYNGSAPNNYQSALDNVSMVATDTVPPTIVDVFFDGSAWDPAFRAACGNASFGYPAQTGAGQLDSMPWSNLNTIYVQFSEPVNAVTAAQVGVRGINLPVYAVSSVTMISSTVARIALAASIGTDRLILDLDGSSAGAITDLAGNKLAGGWVEGVSNFPTSGAAGNNFQYRFVVAVGDASGNGQVRNADLNTLRDNLFNDLPSATFDIYADINGDGIIRNADLNVVRNHLFDDPPGGPGPF